MNVIARHETTLATSDGKPRRVVVSSEVHLRRLRWYVVRRHAFPDGVAGTTPIRDFTERVGPAFWRYRAAVVFAEKIISLEPGNV